MGNQLTPTVSITWHAVNDARTCPVCQAIDGYTWTFTDEVPDSLEHPMYGEVWNTSVGSAAHEHFGAKMGGFPSNCRCHIESEFDLKDIIDKLKLLRDDIKQSLEAST